MSKKGVFITFEGGDGAGKTTQARLLERHLVQAGISCVGTREPGGTPLGELIRPFFLTQELDPEVELLLMLAVRRHHMTTVIQPALARGAWVLCDRFTDSSVVYQGLLRGESAQWVQEWHQRAGIHLVPDLTFIFQESSEVAMARRHNELQENALDINRFDGLPIRSHEKIRQSFLEIALQNPQRCLLVPGGSIEDVASYVRSAVAQRLSLIGVEGLR